MKSIKIAFLLLTLWTMQAVANYSPIQVHYHYPQPGWYVLQNIDPYNAYRCWVQYADGYTVYFIIYPTFVTNPFPMNSQYGCE